MEELEDDAVAPVLALLLVVAAAVADALPVAVIVALPEDAPENIALTVLVRKNSATAAL